MQFSALFLIRGTPFGVLRRGAEIDTSEPQPIQTLRPTEASMAGKCFVLRRE